MIINKRVDFAEYTRIRIRLSINNLPNHPSNRDRLFFPVNIPHFT